MQFIRPDVQTICFGIAMSMGSLLLAGGADGQADGRCRTAGSSSTSPRAASRARPPTSRSTPARRWRCAGRLDEIYARHTGQSVEQVHDDMERDRFFTAEQAVEYGLVDRVIASHEIIRAPTGFGAREAEAEAGPTA